MRLLILLILLVLLVPLTGESALIQKMNTQYSIQSSLNRFTLGQHQQEKTVKNQTFSLQYQAQEILQYGHFSTQWRRVYPDYSTLILRDRSGKEYSLDHDQKIQKEDWFQLSFGLNKNNMSATLSVDKNLSSTPFPQRGANLLLGYLLPEERTQLFTQYSYSEQKRPLSYYSTHDFKVRPRPTRIIQDKIQLGLTHILTERLKGKLFAQSGSRKEDRPRHYGGGGNLAYAVSDQIFGKVGFTYLKENRKRSLSNEMGYLTFQQAQGEILWEPFYDFFISPAYYLTIETEDDPRTQGKMRFASDEYVLGLSQKWGQGNLISTFKVANLRTNQAERAWNIVGGFEWTL